jgi:uncharacterized membrane protein
VKIENGMKLTIEQQRKILLSAATAGAALFLYITGVAVLASTDQWSRNGLIYLILGGLIYITVFTGGLFVAGLFEMDGVYLDAQPQAPKWKMALYAIGSACVFFLLQWLLDSSAITESAKNAAAFMVLAVIGIKLYLDSKRRRSSSI